MLAVSIFFFLRPYLKEIFTARGTLSTLFYKAFSSLPIKMQLR